MHYRNSNFSCPKCRRIVRDYVRDITVAPRVIINMCDELIVRCPYSDLGCAETMERTLAKLHAEKYCEYRPVECPFIGCVLPVPRNKIIPGNTEGRCLHKRLDCEHCGERVREMDMQEHKLNACEVMPMPCTDCNIVLPRRDLIAHLESCPNRTFACVGTSYGCPATNLPMDQRAAHEAGCALARLVPFLETQQSNMRSMEKDIRGLRQRNELLEDLLDTKVDRVEYDFDDIEDDDASPPTYFNSNGTLRQSSYGRRRTAHGDSHRHMHDDGISSGSIWPSRHYRPRVRASIPIHRVRNTAAHRPPYQFDTDLSSTSDTSPIPRRTTASPAISESTTATNDVHTTYNHTIFHNNADRYLLSLHEGLREEVLSLAATVNEVDSRCSANLAMMTDLFRMREEVTHLSIYLNSLRIQLGRLRAPSAAAASVSNGQPPQPSESTNRNPPTMSRAGTRSASPVGEIQTSRSMARGYPTSGSSSGGLDRSRHSMQQPPHEPAPVRRQGSVSRPSSSHNQSGGGSNAVPSTSGGFGMTSSIGGVPIESRGRRVSETAREGTKL